MASRAVRAAAHHKKPEAAAFGFLFFFKPLKLSLTTSLLSLGLDVILKNVRPSRHVWSFVETSIYGI